MPALFNKIKSKSSIQPLVLPLATYQHSQHHSYSSSLEILVGHVKEKVEDHYCEAYGLQIELWRSLALTGGDSELESEDSSSDDLEELYISLLSSIGWRNSQKTI